MKWCFFVGSLYKYQPTFLSFFSSFLLIYFFILLPSSLSSSSSSPPSSSYSFCSSSLSPPPPPPPPPSSFYNIYNTVKNQHIISICICVVFCANNIVANNIHSRPTGREFRCFGSPAVCRGALRRRSWRGKPRGELAKGSRFWWKAGWLYPYLEMVQTTTI